MFVPTVHITIILTSSVQLINFLANGDIARALNAAIAPDIPIIINEFMKINFKPAWNTFLTDLFLKKITI